MQGNCQGPGIGPKTAKRMIIELKDKLNLESMIEGHGDAEMSLSDPGDAAANVRDEVIMALTALGYGNTEAVRSVRAVSGQMRWTVRRFETGFEENYDILGERQWQTNYTTEFAEEDVKIENHLRPQLLKDYIGQQKVKETLSIYIEAARQREEPLDHVLFYGPPGLGKTTLAGIIANEMGVHMKVTSGPAIGKPGEMAAILNNLQEGMSFS